MGLEQLTWGPLMEEKDKNKSKPSVHMVEDCVLDAYADVALGR